MDTFTPPAPAGAGIDTLIPVCRFCPTVALLTDKAGEDPLALDGEKYPEMSSPICEVPRENILIESSDAATIAMFDVIAASNVFSVDTAGRINP